MTPARRVGSLVVALGLALGGCALEERADLLIGRSCDPAVASSCDPGQRCLPHRWEVDPDDFRCRDRASFDPVGGAEAPLAYCDPAAGYDCPGDLVCNADRVRPRDGGLRRDVCQRADGGFAPPRP
jgi:hypothetical protein